MKKILIAVVSLVVCAGVALTLIGGAGNLYENVGTIDDYEISGGLYMMAMLNGYSQARTLINDTDKDVRGETIDGKNGKQWIEDKAEELCLRYVAIQRLCRERGIILSDASAQAVQQQLTYWDLTAEYYAANGIAKNSLIRYYNNQELGNQLFQALYGPGGEMEVSDEDLIARYTDMYANLRYISVPANSTEEGVDVSAEVDAKVAEIVEKLRGGMALEEAATKELGAVYDLVGQEYDKDGITETIQTSYMNYTQANSEIYTPEYLQGLKDLKVGDFGSVKVGSVIMLYEKIPVFETDEDFESMRSSVLSAVMSESFEEYLRAVYDGYDVNWYPGARWFYRASKIDM